MSEKQRDRSQSKKGTAGEEFINELVTSAYSKYWCFPGPKDEDGDKKEIADLLIWFDETLVILSVKNYEFKGNYERYEKMTVEKATRQIIGAEKKLLQSGRDIVVVHPERGRVTIPWASIKRTVRLIVNLGEGQEYYESGRSAGKQSSQYISILDKDAVKAIFQELDTIPDLVKYLNDREVLLASEVKIMIGGRERDLLASYIKRARSFPSTDGLTAATLDIDGSWEEFENNAQKKARDEANQVSYVVDDILNNQLLTQNGGEYYALPLARLCRVERRMLGQRISLAMNEVYKADAFSSLKYMLYNDIAFCILVFASMERQGLQQLLQLASFGIKLQQGNSVRAIFGIGHAKKQDDYLFLHTSDFSGMTSEDRQMIQADLKDLGWLQSVKAHHYITKEFPD